MIEATVAPAWIDPDRVAAPSTAPQNGAGRDFKPFGADGFTFWDLLDVINPLQHIPIISSIYRKITGDEISPVARIAGATLFGGPIGAAVAVVDTAVEHKTGRDIGATAMAALFPDEDVPDATDTQVALRQVKPAQGFAPTVADPLQLAPAPFEAAAGPDLQALAGFATASGGAPAIGEPIKLEPRHAIEAWQAARPLDEVRAVPSRHAPLPDPHLPKGAAATLARRATRAYAASAAAAPTPNGAPPPTASLARETAEARNDWIVEAMMRAMDKYQASHRLQSAAAGPAQAVWR